MRLDKAIKKNPYDPNRGNESAYTRYLRYNVDGFYGLSTEEVKKLWHDAEKNSELSTEVGNGSYK